MKYYINYEKNTILIDENEYTPYLKGRGYIEVSKEEYDKKRKEFAEQHKNRHSKKGLSNGENR